MKDKIVLLLIIVALFVFVFVLLTKSKPISLQEQLLDAYCQGWHDSERWKDEAPLTRELRFEVDSLCFKVKLLER